MTEPTTAEQTQPKPEYYDRDDSDNVCFLCGEPNYTTRFEITHYDFSFTFKECQCGLVKQTPMPNEKFFEWFFNSSVFYSSQKTGKKSIWGYFDYFGEEPSRLRSDKWRFKKLRKYFESLDPDLSKLKIVQIGSGGGSFLHVAGEAGIDARGSDVSGGFADFARKTYGVAVDVGRFEDTDYADGQFDAVILFNVIENVPNQVEFLTAINKKLKPGGLFILNYVDTKKNMIESMQKEKYFLYRPPVTYIFDTPVLNRTLDKFGFETVDTIHDKRTLNLEKIFTLLSMNWMQRILKALRLHKIQLRLWAYPSRVVIAKKTREADEK
jgi:SAM-dependent methyltransferase